MAVEGWDTNLKLKYCPKSTKIIVVDTFCFQEKTYKCNKSKRCQKVSIHVKGLKNTSVYWPTDE